MEVNEKPGEPNPDERPGDFAPGELDRLLAEGEADIERGDVLTLDEAWEHFRRLASGTRQGG